MEPTRQQKLRDIARVESILGEEQLPFPEAQDLASNAGNNNPLEAADSAVRVRERAGLSMAAAQRIRDTILHGE